MANNKRSDIVGFHNIKNKVSRNAFDLSHRHMFTAQIGQLLPIFTQWVNPNETFKIGYNGFSRTASLQTAAFTRLKENVQYYFVPFSALWRYFEQQVNNMTKGQSGENISKIATSFTDNSTITTGMPYLNYSWLKNYITGILDYEMGLICPLITSASVSVTDIIKQLQKGGVWDTDKTDCLIHGTFRHSVACKLLRSLGYGNFPLEFYDPLSSAMSYASEKNIYPPTFSSVKNDDTYGYTSFSSGSSTSGYVDLINSPNLSIFPLLAYHKICQDHYKYRQWQAYDSTICNIDYLQPTDSMNFSSQMGNSFVTMNDFFCLEYSNLPLDYINGVLPRAQYGDESAATISGDLKVSSLTGFAGAAEFTNTASSVTQTDGRSLNGDLKAVSGKVYVDTGSSSSYNAVVTSPHTHQVTFTGGTTDTNATLKISALRSAIALQKYKEIQESNDSDFASQVLAHFGVKPHCDSRKSVFIGGSDSTININPQINQNLIEDNDPEIKATGTSQLSVGCKFTSDTFGIIIGIYRCVPQLDLARVSIDRQLVKTDASDFPLPELDSIGMQSQYRFEVIAPSCGSLRADANMSSGSSGSVDMSKTYGYLPRYAEYKTSFDRFEGAFLDSLSSWVTGYNYDKLRSFMLHSSNNEIIYPQISAFLECDPSITYPLWLNQTSLTSNDDKIYVGSVNTCIAVRPFSVYGLPYSH